MKHYKLKILTAGEGAVGKTTYLQRYTTGSFLESLKLTIGVEFFTKTVIIDDNECYLIIWDFGGQNQFRRILPSYVAGAHGALFMFDLTRIVQSLKNVEDWWRVLTKHGDIPIILLGTKLDLVTVKLTPYDFEYIKSVKKDYNFVEYMETSSKTGENIEKGILTLITSILDKN